MNESESREIIFGDFNLSLGLFREILKNYGLKSATTKFSFDEARRFSDELILVKDVEQVHKLIKANPSGAVSFYEFAHEVEDRHNFEKLDFISQSDGRHEPFLLLASATRNLMDVREEELREEQEAE
ncbi:MAG: hypothetical protein ABI254_11520 [Chthoniobacterales bacterium]